MGINCKKLIAKSKSAFKRIENENEKRVKEERKSSKKTIKNKQPT